MAVRRVVQILPGKIMLSGEYAVLMPEGWAVALSLQGQFEAFGECSTTRQVTLPDLNLAWSVPWPLLSASLTMPELPAALRFPLWAIRLLAEAGQESSSDVRDSLPGFSWGFRRVGIGPHMVGTSSAMSVGVVRVLQRLWGLGLTRKRSFRLAALAHAVAQGGGSGYAVATCMGRGVTSYRRNDQPLPWESPAIRSLCTNPDDPVVLSTWRQHVSAALTSSDWPTVRRGELPSGMKLVLADTGRRSLTGGHVHRFQDAVRLSEPFRREALGHLASSRALGLALTTNASERDVREAVADARRTLLGLDRLGDLGIHVSQILRLLELADGTGIAAKVSGAGGGDFVAGFTWDDAQAGAFTLACSIEGFRSWVQPVPSPVGENESTADNL